MQVQRRLHTKNNITQLSSVSRRCTTAGSRGTPNKFWPSGKTASNDVTHDEKFYSDDRIRQYRSLSNNIVPVTITTRPLTVNIFADETYIFFNFRRRFIIKFDLQGLLYALSHQFSLINIKTTNIFFLQAFKFQLKRFVKRQGCALKWGSQFRFQKSENFLLNE